MELEDLEVLMTAERENNPNHYFVTQSEFDRQYTNLGPELRFFEKIPGSQFEHWVAVRLADGRLMRVDPMLPL